MAVRGTFDLNERPATEALRRIEREGERTQATMVALGKSVDETFSTKNVAEAKAYEEQLGKDREEVKLLAADLKTLGAIDANARVNIRGIDEALLKTELLLNRLKAIDGRSVSPNVGLGAVPTAARSSGGSSFGGGGLKVPFAGSIPFPLIGAALAATPPLVGGAGALLGSAGGATLGLGALGVAGFGAGAAAGGLAAPTSIAAIKDISASSDALKKFREEVLQTGADSKASQQAMRVYRQSLASAPRGTASFLRARTQLGEEFNQVTRPGQSSVARIGTRGINAARQLTPELGALSNTFMRGAQTQTDNFADFLTDPQSRDFYRAMSKEATADLSGVEGISENVVRTMENIARASRPFFHEGVVFLEHWTEGWKHSTNDLKGTRSEIGEFVDDLKAWGKLGGAGAGLLGDLLGSGRKPGTSMVNDLTKQLETWDQWVERNPRKVNQFFDDAVDGTEKIAGALGKISGLLWETGKALTPILEQGTQLVSLLDNTGLLSTGGLPLLLAGGAGVRNAKRGFAGRVTGMGGGGAGGAPLLLGGGGGGGRGAGWGAYGRERYGSPLGRGDLRSAYSLEREGAGRLGSLSTVARGTKIGGAAEAFGRGFVGRVGPLLAISGLLGAAATPGNLPTRLAGGLNQATFGAFPVPADQEEQYKSGYAEALKYLHTDQAVGHKQGLGKEARRGVELRQARAGAKYRGEDPSLLGAAAAYRQDVERIEAQLRGGATGKVADIQGALNVNMAHGVAGSRRTAISGLASAVKGANNPLAASVIGGEGLDLAKALAKENPKLKGAVDELTQTVVTRMREMGREVAVIHGNIVDVSQKSWSKVADAAESETQRALAATTKNLTAMEHQAMDILRNMGFSGADARGIAKSTFGEHGKAAESAANTITQHGGTAGIPYSPSTIATATGHGKKHFAGGRLAGQGLHDTINLGGGNMAAPGETIIANRHTERRIDRILAGAGTSLGREIGKEGRAHSEPFRKFSATGSIMPAAKLAQQMGLTPGEGPGFGGATPGVHVGDSLHYQGLAYDITGSAAQMMAYRKRAEKTFLGHGLNELFYDPYSYYIDQGHKVPGAIGGHSDHVHIGFFPGGAKGNITGGGNRGRAAGHPQVHLKGMKSGVGGLTGLIADHANQTIANAGSRNLNKLLGRGGGGRPGQIPGGLGGSPQKNMMLARSMLGNFGWGGDEMGALKSLWTQESGWSQTARNPSSGAYGIPQALPPSKMGADAQGSGPAAARAQIIWGLKYIKERYGSPSGAWAHEQSSNWYSRGGRVPGFAGWFKNGGHFRVKNPTMFGAGEGGVTEDVHVTPMGRGPKGGGGGGVSVGVTIGTVYARDPSEARNVGRRIGQGIAKELAGALNGSNGVSDREVD